MSAKTREEEIAETLRERGFVTGSDLHYLVNENKRLREAQNTKRQEFAAIKAEVEGE